MNIKGRLAIERALESVRSSIVPLTPRLTGRLAGSIGGHAQVGGDSIYTVKQKGNMVIGTIGSNVPYALAQELTNPTKKGFFTRGFNQARSKVLGIIKNTLRL